VGLTARAREALRAFLAPAEKTAGSQQAWNIAFSTGLDNWMALFGIAKLTRPFAQHPTVYAAVSAISQGISALPIEMFPDSDTKKEEPIKDSDVLKLLTTPGPDMDGPQLIEGTIDFMELTGEAFWFMDGYARRGPSGPKLPTSLTLWDPLNVRAELNGGRVTRWGYQDSGDIFWTEPGNVIQFKHFNPYDPIRGLAPLQAAMLAAQGGYKALTYQDAFFENGCTFGGLLMPKEGAIIQPEAMQRMRSELEARHQGPGKRGRLATINAPVDYTEMGISQKDMDFPDWLDASSSFILMVFKVPPSVAGLQKDANYNASVQQAKQFWFNHLPLAHYIERRIKARLCTAFGIAESPYFKTESIKAMTEDQLALSNQARNLFNMGVSFKDINDRLELGYPADDIAADTRWVPFSLVNADEQATAPPKQQASSNAQAGQQNQPGDMPTQAAPGAGKAMQTSRELIRKISWRTLISKVRDEEEAYARLVRQHFFVLRNVVMSNLRTRKAIKLTGDIDIEAVLFDDDKAAKDIEKKTEPIYKSAMEKGAETVIRELSLEIDFSFLSPGAAKFLHEKMFEIADLVDGPLKDALRFQLEEGVRLGESVDKIADRVSETFDSQRFRAYRIARTEVAESFNGGRYATMKEAGVERIEWLSARDDRVRDSHEEVDGEVIVLGDKFSNGLLYPLDPAGPPEEIVNCRCVSVPVA
jgi:HK97 family phage portal protein